MKTKIEIIQETVAYYSEDPSRRGTDRQGNFCAYLTEEGNMCAVGRCMISPSTQMAGSIRTLSRDDAPVILEEELKPEYRGHVPSFWSNLQDLHDRRFHWTDTGLSKKGEECVARLLKAYSNQ